MIRKLAKARQRAKLEAKDGANSIQHTGEKVLAVLRKGDGTEIRIEGAKNQ